MRVNRWEVEKWERFRVLTGGGGGGWGSIEGGKGEWGVDDYWVEKGWCVSRGGTGGGRSRGYRVDNGWGGEETVTGLIGV